jgi:hypothetical protein
MILISNTYWAGMPFNYRGPLPAGASVEPVLVRSDDGREPTGLFYSPDPAIRQDVAVLVMHPKVDFSRHYCIPPLLGAGVACLALNTRCLNNDTMAIHEDLLLDVNAGMRFLRRRGFGRVVLFGNSGGGALFSFFQAQASKPQGQRIATTPAGDPTKLNRSEMLPADGLILVSAHRGEGHVLMECIDPSVVDEADPTLTDSTLDMYDVRNGFAPPPAPSRYGADFVARFRAAQHARVARLDAMARAMVEEARHYERRWNEAPADTDFMARHRWGRLAALERVMVVYRTMANLHYTDPTLDPSSRSYGSLLSDRPDLMNLQATGFCRVIRPEAWLSTWSGLSSRAATETQLRQISDIPVLMVNATRDREIYPRSDADALWQAVSVPDRTRLDIPAEHYFEPPFGQKEAPDVATLMAQVIPWIRERFAG